MTDTEIIERYFKSRGWHPKQKEWLGWVASNGLVYPELPPILTDFPAFKEHVLEVMAEEDYKPDLVGGYAFRWVKGDEWHELSLYKSDIKDNNILHAAVKSSTRYWEGKNE